MKIRKMLVLLLASLFLLTFAGCTSGKQESANQQEGNQEQNNQAPEQETPDQTPEDPAVVLDGVTTPEDATDGTYTAEGTTDDYGWAPFVTLEIADGKITSVDFDYKNGDALKSEDEDYNKSMESAVGTKPETYLPEYEEALVESQDIKEVDTISGATQSHSEFVRLVQEALGKAVGK